MALTDSEKGEIMLHMGYSARVLIAGNTDYSKILADRFLDLPEFAEKRLKSDLKRIKAIDVKLEEATERYKVESVEGFKLNPNETKMLKKDKRELIKHLGYTLGVPVMASSGIGVSI